MSIETFERPRSEYYDLVTVTLQLRRDVVDEISHVAIESSTTVEYVIESLLKACVLGYVQLVPEGRTS